MVDSTNRSKAVVLVLVLLFVALWFILRGDLFFCLTLFLSFSVLLALRLPRLGNGSVFSKARYMNRVGFEILARTPVSKLP